MEKPKRGLRAPLVIGLMAIVGFFLASVWVIALTDYSQKEREFLDQQFESYHHQGRRDFSQGTHDILRWTELHPFASVTIWFLPAVLAAILAYRKYGSRAVGGYITFLGVVAVFLIFNGLQYSLLVEQMLKSP